MLWQDLLHLYIMKDAIDNFGGILFVIDTTLPNVSLMSMCLPGILWETDW